MFEHPPSISAAQAPMLRAPQSPADLVSLAALALVHMARVEMLFDEAFRRCAEDAG